MIIENLSTLKINKLTQEQYNAALAAGNINENELYLTPEEERYTNVEIDSKLSTKSDKTHNHDSAYDAKGSAENALSSAKLYTNQQVANKANATHTHTIENVTNLQTELDSLENSISTHTHKYAGSSSVGGAANSADKLATARTIAISGGATGTATSFDGSSNISIPVTGINEAYLNWGGKDISGNVSPLDAALIADMSPNRLAFMKADDIIVEYSRDGGATWLDYGLSDAQKQALVTASGAACIGKRELDNGTVTTDWKVRITLTARNGSLYFRARKTAIYLGSNGTSGTNLTVEYANCGSDNTFKIYKSNIPVSGWSGWNMIQMSAAFGGGDNQTTNWRKIRFTFGITGLSDIYDNNFAIYKLYMYGDTAWASPSTMASTGHLYSYDSNQNATFPAKVTATTFAGSLSGNASSATKATQDSDGNVITSTYAKQLAVDQAIADVNTNKANKTHSHAISDVTNLQSALDGKSNAGHNHDSVYEKKTDASSKLTEAKNYADTAATTAATKVKNDLLNGAGAAYDTLKELGELIDDNKDAIDVLNDVAASKADKTHTHTTNDITDLQSKLDKKVDDDYLFSAESTGDTVIWDGNTTGLTSTPDGLHYKVSDVAPTLDELSDGLMFDGTEYTIENYDINELGSGILSIGYVDDVVFVPESGVNVNINGELFPEAGTYISIDAYENHDLVLTVKNYTKYPIIKKVKKNLLPDNPLPDNVVEDADLAYFGASSKIVGKYNAVAYGNGKFVALPYRESSDSKFIYSTDGKNWTEVSASASAYWKDIVYADNKFVAISSTSNGSGYHGAVSTDGINWTATTLPSGGSPSQLTYGNGRFVYVGSNQVTAWSTDGVNWTQVLFPSYGYPTGIAYGKGKFIAPTSSGKYYYSTNGGSWTEATMITANVSDIVFDGTKFVAVGRNNAMYSTDGISWTQSTIPTNANYACLAYGGGIYVALGYHSNVAMYSYDGINWIGANTDAVDNWGDIAYGNGIFVAGTEDGFNMLTIEIGNKYGLAYQKDVTSSNKWKCLADTSVADGANGVPITLTDDLRNYSEAQVIIYGGDGFDGNCKAHVYTGTSSAGVYLGGRMLYDADDGARYTSIIIPSIYEIDEGSYLFAISDDDFWVTTTNSTTGGTISFKSGGTLVTSSVTSLCVYLTDSRTFKGAGGRVIVIAR